MDLVCFTLRGKKYHKVVWKLDKATRIQYAVTACGLIDSSEWDLRVAENDPKWTRDRTPCERCEKNETKEG